MKKRIIVLGCMLLLVAALPSFAAFDAFLKFDGIQGEATTPGYQGWIEASSFSWGLVQPGAISVRQSANRCAVHEFVIMKRVDKATPILFQAAATGRHFPTVVLSVNGERHMLQNVIIKNVRQVPLPNGGTGQQITFDFTRCETHESPGVITASAGFPKTPANLIQKDKIYSKIEVNGTLMLPNGQNGAITLDEVRLLGSNGAIIAVRESAGSPAIAGLLPYFRAKQKLPVLTLAARNANGPYLRFEFHDVLISSYSVSSGGDHTFTINFSRFTGPMSGFRNEYHK